MISLEELKESSEKFGEVLKERFENHDKEIKNILSDMILIAETMRALSNTTVDAHNAVECLIDDVNTMQNQMLLYLETRT